MIMWPVQWTLLFPRVTSIIAYKWRTILRIVPMMTDRERVAALIKLSRT